MDYIENRTKTLQID